MSQTTQRQRVFHEYVRDHKIIIYEQKAAGQWRRSGSGGGSGWGRGPLQAYLISGISKCAHMEDGDADADADADAKMQMQQPTQQPNNRQR